MNDEELLKIDIYSRLPYGVKAISASSSSQGEEVTGMYPSGEFFLGDNHKIVHNPIKPILFHISCLTEEIQFRGEEIVPLIELAKIEGHLEKITRLENKWGVLQIASGRMCESDLELEFAFDSDDKSFTIADSKDATSLDVFNSLALYDWLNSHMIDYRGLIDKGLAVSIWDLDENPYEF